MAQNSFGYNQYWETAEFEDLVAKGLIGLFEENVKQSKKGPKFLRFKKQNFEKIKTHGCYFAPHDRVVAVAKTKDGRSAGVQNIDMINDGVPDIAVYTTRPWGRLQDEGCYLVGSVLKKIKRLPKGFVSDKRGTPYKFTQLFYYGDGVAGCPDYMVITKDGELLPAYGWSQITDPITGRSISFKNRPILEDKKEDSYEDYNVVWASVTLQLYQDRQYLWNVQAIEGEAKATFGVYPEQIQSLFYARSLPETSTGRKRPILHWVQSHQRRMKSGTDIDIKEHLRGISEFEMGGTHFKITNPQKENEANKLWTT